MHARRPEASLRVLIWLALAVTLSYANVLPGTFQFDDYNVIVNEAQVHTWAAWFASLGHGIRPLLKFSYTLNWTLGLGVIGFHLTNIVIHLANAYLVYRLAQVFVEQQWQREQLRSVPLLSALLFAVHPIHTEAVSYISGRSASLMTLFYLAALWCYVSGRTQQRKLHLYVGAPLLFVLALATKETAITFPFALLLWESACGGRWRAAFKQQWPVWLAAGITALLFVFSDSYSTQMQRSAEFNSLQGNLATQFSAFAYLLRQWALPVWLNIDPDLPMLHDLSNSILPLLLFISLCAVMLICWRRRPWISFALAWVMLQLIALYLLLPRLDIANERQWYLASWPLLLALSIELTLWLNAKKLQVLAAALLLAYISLTLWRNQAYLSEVNLWEATAIRSPDKARVHNNLGHAYLLAQRHEEARREFTTALRLDPDLYQAHYNLLRVEEEITSSRDRNASPVSAP